MTHAEKKTIRAPRNRVRISRVRRDLLVKMTTIKPIETAPTEPDEDGLGILASTDSGWIECFFDNGNWVDLDGNALGGVTHWLPLPRFTADDFKTI